MDRRSFAQLLGGGLALGAPWSAMAQGAGSYPNKPIRLIVPFPAGGAADLLARPMGRYLQDKLGQSVVIDNKPGANTMIGLENVVNSPADGYTLICANEAGMSIGPAMEPVTKVRVPYKPASDFATISLLGHFGSLCTGAPDAPFKTFPEFIAYAKANPGKLSYASVGTGSQPHMMMETLCRQAGIQMVHVPYQGVAPAVVAVAAGQCQVMISAPSAPMPFVKDGRLRGLAYSGTKRLSVLPNVPTFAEGGMPNFEARGWFGILVHAATPAPIRKVLSDACWSIVQSPEYQANAITANGYESPIADPAQFPAFLAEDMRKWKVTVEALRDRLV
ncbi:MAG: tripartite tricarboxylate transporter substrate binding protein [Pseudomonadota bacterium]